MAPAEQPTNGRRQPYEPKDPLYDPYRRTDRYGIMGKAPQPWTEYARLFLLGITLVPIKAVVCFGECYALLRGICWPEVCCCHLRHGTKRLLDVLGRECSNGLSQYRMHLCCRVSILLLRLLAHLGTGTSRSTGSLSRGHPEGEPYSYLSQVSAYHTWFRSKRIGFTSRLRPHSADVCCHCQLLTDSSELVSCSLARDQRCLVWAL